LTKDAIKWLVVFHSGQGVGDSKKINDKGSMQPMALIAIK
jgi:hypothetical protein